MSNAPARPDRAMSPDSATYESQLKAAHEAVVTLELPRSSWYKFTGPDSANYLHRMTSNHVENLAPGAGQHSLYMNAKGRILSELWLYRLSAEEIWVELPASVAEKTAARLKIYRLNSQFEIEPMTESRCWDVTGEKADALLAKLGLEAPKVNYSHSHGSVGAAQVMVVKRPDLYASRYSLLAQSNADEFADKLTAAIAELNGAELGPVVSDFIRIDNGLPQFGRDLTDDMLPQEAFLEEDALHFDKGCYPGQETVAKIKYRGKVNRLLAKLQINLESGAEAPTEAQVLRIGDKKAGVVTSFVPAADGSLLGLGLIKRDHIEAGKELTLDEDRGTAVVTPLR